MIKKLLTLIAALGAIAGVVVALPAEAQERAVKIAGFGAKSGVVRVFGINSEAALKAALEQINNAGGVTLGDGTKGKIALEYYDDRCNAEEGISVVRRIASTEAIIAVGPTCSNVAESLFGILQKKVGDSSDSGASIPDHRRRRGERRTCQDFGVGIPQRAERVRDVQVAVRLGEDAVPGRQDDLRRRGKGLRAFQRNLQRDQGAGRSQRARRCWGRASGF